MTTTLVNLRKEMFATTKKLYSSDFKKGQALRCPMFIQLLGTWYGLRLLRAEGVPAIVCPISPDDTGSIGIGF